MPVKAIRTVSSGRNGLSTYILPLTTLSFHYSDWAGSSKGMNSFIRHLLPSFASSHPSVEITVEPLRGGPSSHPFIRATYNARHAGKPRQKAICVRNLEPGQILKKVNLLRDSSGEKNRRVRGRVVESGNEGVRGIWSGLHEREGRRV